MATGRSSDGKLLLGGVPLIGLARDPRIGTPSYVYDLDGIEAGARALDAAFDGTPHLVAYAVKANTAGPVVRTIASCGCGADVVSGGELEVALACGVAPERIVYSGVAKEDAEIDGAVGAGIGAIQLESVEEIARVATRARAAGKRARVSIRMNPAVDREAMGTHAHIATGHDEAKFGIPRDDLARAIDLVLQRSELSLVGLGVHTGSQLTTTDAYVQAARVCFGLAAEVRGRAKDLAFVDSGGGFGVDYGSGCAASPADFVRAARQEQARAGLADLALYVEPGRSLVAAHGVLLSRVIQKKESGERRWLMIDCGMNDSRAPRSIRRGTAWWSSRRRWARAARASAWSGRSARAPTTSGFTTSRSTSRARSPSSTAAPTASRWPAATTGASSLPRCS